ncbi:HlyD family efflux transporter periplasmic adaptor subunit [Rhodoblastus acidophilus]|uniref:HlyD family efflux transporter periplasmic adaptor subunit n=1 Tax=Candidatus Rhodoblastus alkanivorans TaxID=2954117 RepID=A0ABS9Z8J1_9HYPH|nr:HlyD family efflux transporter periplasmic adaptor subunit [Candidatus Rhodoblastus alkanivorans]MCI4680868.1 HlyD family efflux transporter periplasmic adaptor subunit [Candidatus Rhodoblastus alkanivorans]MCI4683994.1 HlyD family efflux transporter periplasmic adaptor subunit [Candidatus Rhodoblastus alkanivorans]MDI4641313.1 HlyD family efflux transporter periplasmic adaptor subunit [Rhodoblastus acidophilus]
MKKVRKLLAALVVLAIIGWAAGKVFAPAKPQNIFAGYVEGDLVQIGPVEGERLAKLDVEPGDNVTRDETLFTMATPVLDEQCAEARAKVAQAQANLKNLQAALQRPEQIAVLQAAVASAKAALVLSQTEYDRQQTLLKKGFASAAARDQAKFALDRDKANLAQAERQVEAGLIPARHQEIAAAQAAITQAQAELNQIEVRIARQTVHAPAKGIIQDVYFWPGEIVPSGQPILALLPPENRKIRFYVPEPQLARFRLGAKVAVSCDNCRPGLKARVIYISQQAEYTPPVIFSLQERGKLVFRVDARLDDPSVLLPLGLPISAKLVASQAVEAAK